MARPHGRRGRHGTLRTLYWVDTTIVPLLDARRKPCQYLAIRSDITQRKDAESQLREQAALAKLGELAAIVVHEVRNPLAGIKGSLQILGSRMPEGTKDRQIVGIMMDRLDALGARVNDILLYAGTTPPSRQAVALGPVLSDVVSSARAAIVSGAVEIIASGTEVIVHADPHMLREVLLNLVLNACQASRAGQVIEIAIDIHGDSARVRILDCGPGISPEARERIFEPFFTTRLGGTGLGLAIVKRLLERQGGTVALTIVLTAVPRPSWRCHLIAAERVVRPSASLGIFPGLPAKVPVLSPGTRVFLCNPGHTVARRVRHDCCP